MENEKFINYCQCDEALTDSFMLITRYRDDLEIQKYRETTKSHYVAAVKHFIYWLGRRPACERKISHPMVQMYINKHLPVCCCPKPNPKNIKIVRAALNKLLLMKGQPRFIRIADCGRSNIDSAIHSFDSYLNNICGLAYETRWYHRRHIQTLLIWLFDSDPIDVCKITPEVLCRYIAIQAPKYQAGSIGVLVYSIRIYLKFLQFSGCDTVSMAAKIPRPPNWSAANIPNTLKAEELAKFLGAFDRSTAIGKRDYAMARCFTDLGLRCYEVANLRLDSINWHTGVLHLESNKNRKESILPLPDTTGNALISYLRDGRPETNSRSIFVYHRAPVGKAVCRTTVRGAIRRAFSRADLPWSGTHILRSTTASQLLKGGATLKEIADLLRHKDINTTKYYTKVDLLNLSKVALPWPERGMA